MPTEPFIASTIDLVPAVTVGDGCVRRDLPTSQAARWWVVEFAPGAIWPHVDEHPDGENYVVLEGEVIEGDRRFGAGSVVSFPPGSQHRPRSETGARLLGFNVVHA